MCVPGAFISIRATYYVERGIALFISNILVALITYRLSLYAVQRSPAVYGEVILINYGRPFTSDLFATAYGITFHFYHVFVDVRHAIGFLLLEYAVVYMQAAGVGPG